MNFDVKVEGMSPLAVFLHDPENSWTRDDEGHFGLPSQLMGPVIFKAGRSFQDPVDRRKTVAKRLELGLTIPASFSSFRRKSPDFERKVGPKIAGIIRDWKADFQLTVLDDNISEELLRKILEGAGRFIGVGHLTPDYGRFRVRLQIS